MGVNTVIICGDYKAKAGHCFINDTSKDWRQVTFERAKKMKATPIRCSHGKCKRPAVWLDHHYPYYSDHNDCGHHKS